MKLRNRFLLVILGIIIFILATPVIILYALGYKVDYQSGKILKTGSLVAQSEPAKAQIYLNDELQKKRTGATIRFLLPGDYNVKISKDGYQSWTKRLAIQSSIVTWTNFERSFVDLFLTQPKPKATNLASLAAASVSANSAVVIQDNKLNTLNLNRGSLDNLQTTLPTMAPALTFPNPEMLYAYLRYPTAQKTSLDLSKAKQLETNSSFAAILMDNTLYFVKDGALIKQATNVSGLHLENEHLWYVEANVLKHLDLNLGIAENIMTLPYAPATSLVIRGNSRIFLVLDQNLYMVNDTAEEIYRGANYAYWDQMAKLLVFGNNNEALLFMPDTFKTELIIRSSTQISQPTVNAETGYLFFLNEGRVKAIELDGRDHRNVYTIAETPAKSFLLSDNGKLLHLFTDTEVQTLEIR